MYCILSNVYVTCMQNIKLRRFSLSPRSKPSSVIQRFHTGFRLKFRSCCIISNKYRVWSDVYYDNGYKN